jgi:hypothetical protein
MKSQDLVVLLKLVSLERAEQLASRSRDASAALPFDWEGWEVTAEPQLVADVTPGEARLPAERYAVRGLSASLGIGKSEVAAALRRSMEVGLAYMESGLGNKDRRTETPRANGRELLDLLAHCVRYVFPARPGALARGIPTTFAAPVLAGDVLSAGEAICVWPHARGSRMGQTITPLFRSVPEAVQRDPDLYAMLALVDAIRIGNPRERSIARERLSQMLSFQ